MPLFGTYSSNLNSKRGHRPVAVRPPVVGWQILMMYSGKKVTNTEWLTATAEPIARRTAMGNPGHPSFRTTDINSSGAVSRTILGQGQGVYSAFYDQTNITKIALIDGTGDLDPATNTNHLVYDLVESTGSESIYDILRRLDEYQRTAPGFQRNDTVWGDPSVLNHTAGTNGYSGLLTASAGTAFSAFNRSGVNQGLPGRFCVLGINRDSDNDIQALCAFSGNLQSGKGDAWRGANPEQTFWSYWGNDFHSNSTTQTLGGSLQTAPGVATQCSYTGDVYLLGYSAA